MSKDTKKEFPLFEEGDAGGGDAGGFDGASLSNTPGMGEVDFPTGDERGSGDMPTFFQVSNPYDNGDEKKKKGKSSKKKKENNKKKSMKDFNSFMKEISKTQPSNK